MPTPLTIYVFIGAILVSFIAGAVVDHKFRQAHEVNVAHAQTEQAQQGETKIIHDTQVITKVIHDNAKTEPCLSRAVPPDINNLLH